ncbi:carbon storage regulator [Pirellulaceae bacterium]|jgi:carbon storage regulator|nr:carbon storage regulator [Pirellulaceae bacterium]
MLVLSRKKTQRLKLGDDIVVTVIDVSGEKVRLGIDAPREVTILREELELRDEAKIPKKKAS